MLAPEPPQVLLGETPVTFKRGNAAALLVYLAVSGRAHARDVLVALFTPAAPRSEKIPAPTIDPTPMNAA